ncbi:MAG: hypothetical protein DRO88_13740 [Promethearchaeia archaeon]|nr:MAG: hypothetical protein DRO88_13740 [Candidatus Lokiarchaeia archaeon]
MYINSCIPWQNPSSNFIKNLSLCHKVGYQAAIIDLNSKKDYDQFIGSDFFPKSAPKIKFPLSIESILNYKMKNSPIPLIPRITLSPETPTTLKKELSRWRDKRCLIAVKSLNKEILEVASRDGRVDILSIANNENQKALTKGIISLAQQNNCFLDLSLSNIIESEHYKRTKLLRTLYKLFLSAKPSTHQYLLGSGSIIGKNPWLMRGPKETIAFLNSVFNIPEFQAKKILQYNPELIVLRFIKRDQKLFLEPGVEIVNIEKKSEK